MPRPQPRQLNLPSSRRTSAEPPRDVHDVGATASPQFEHLGLRIAVGVLRPKPQLEHLGLRIAVGVLRPKPQSYGSG